MPDHLAGAATAGADEALLRWATGLEPALAGLGRLDQRA
jgi:hypothetical protein